MENRLMVSDAELEYFVQWGGESWKGLMSIAIDQFLGHRLDGQSVLDIGAGSGRMSCLFALLGARVTGIDIHADFVGSAESEAVRWGVRDRTEFLAYDGNLDALPDKNFDIVFTKSVLVIVPHLDNFLRKASSKLKCGGKAVFLENGRGNRLVHALRLIRHPRWDFRSATLFTQRELTIVGRVFDLRLVRTWTFPPVFLICGEKRTA